ncbi:purine-binding chemotaxis protein CheW [Pontibacter sp. JH31]|uniref:Purine-binding chemotaxis protein CheW n=1 Tax=Pontibacter aquaedesilientis TaxID=2766980 RepID=A0ABR7XDE1_9BACT|nr:chemotaxis protein CheW [Pontibacter aquaedesilientis]MBD1396300.1 purine-binding chemotaxis protein CheW [Pontibacter aquaedesilientis]
MKDQTINKEQVKSESATSTPPSNPKEANKQETVAKPAAVNTETIHLIVFKLGTEEYGIKIDQVKEVTVTPSVTRMPRTPDFIKGVANIRGDIIAIMDLESRFGISPAPLSNDSNPAITYTLVVEAKEYSIGVIVREVPQSLNMPMTKIDKTPSFLQDINIQENYIEGIAKVNNRLIIVLDMFKILTQDEIRELKN